MRQATRLLGALALGCALLATAPAADAAEATEIRFARQETRREEEVSRVDLDRLARRVVHERCDAQDLVFDARGVATREACRREEL